MGSLKVVLQSLIQYHLGVTKMGLFHLLEGFCEYGFCLPFFKFLHILDPLHSIN